MSIPALDISRCEEAMIDTDTANIIMQLQEWFNARCDQLQMMANAPASTTFSIQGPDGDALDIDDKNVAKGIRIGARMALNVLGEFPVSIHNNQGNHDEEE